MLALVVSVVADVAKDTPPVLATAIAPVLPIVASPLMAFVTHCVPEPMSRLPAVAAVEPRATPLIWATVPEIEVVPLPDKSPESVIVWFAVRKAAPFVSWFVLVIGATVQLMMVPFVTHQSPFVRVLACSSPTLTVIAVAPEPVASPDSVMDWLPVR